MSACLFCKIAAGEIPATIVHQNEHVFAFKDIHPQAPLHVLVCPRRHIPTLNDLLPGDAELTGQMVLAAKQIALNAGVSADGYRTVFNCNAGAGQTVFHVHLHVLGGRPLTWPPG